MNLDIGDLVRVEGFNKDNAEVDPNGFVGIISSASLLMDNAGDVDNGEVVFSVSLPVEWQKGKNEWTFKKSELTLIEENVTNQ